MSFDLGKPLVFVDIETTGSSPLRSRILEIGIIRYEGGKEVARFSSVIDPESGIPLSILNLTGIQEQEINKAPTFATIAHDIKNLLEGAIFVAHNVRFDYSFIKEEFQRLGITFSSPQLCTVRLSRALYKEESHHDLSSLIDRHGFECENRHRALDDALVLIDFLKHVFAQDQEKAMVAIEKILGRRRLPNFVDEKIINDLPEKSGVYIFYGEDGDILYIGKSVNIKARVVSHFGGTTKNTLRFLDEVRDIEARVTSGELSALLLESFLIKKQQPLYNKISRTAKKLVCIIEGESNGYKTISIESYNQDELQYSEKILGIFKSKMQARKVIDAYIKEYKLCPKLCGVEKGSGPCFYSQLGMCLGACSGKELSDSYNLRFLQAWTTRKLKAWRYGGPIMIREVQSKEQGTMHIIDEWRLRGSLAYDGEVVRSFLPESYSFDYDAYKILVGYMRSHKKDITTLNETEATRLLTF